MKDQDKTKEQLISELEELRLEKHGHKQVEEKQRESEEHYRILVDSTPDFIYSLDRESRHTAVNQSVCKALGLNAQDIIGKNHTDLGFPDDIVREWKPLHQKVLSKEVVKTETTTPLPDGSLHTYEVVLMPICDERGVVKGIRGTSRDITERKQAEEILKQYSERLEKMVAERTAKLTKANDHLQQEITERKKAEEELRKGKELLQNILNTALSLIVVRDLDGRRLLVNKEFERRTGIRLEQAIGGTPYDIHSPEVAARILNDDHQVLESRKPLIVERTTLLKGKVYTLYIAAKGELSTTCPRGKGVDNYRVL